MGTKDGEIKMKRNPIEITNYIEHEFSEFISSTYIIDDQNYEEQLQERLAQLTLFQGPYLHTVLPFSKGQSLEDLIQEGKISPAFSKLSNIHLQRSLYAHQQVALEKIEAGHNVVITTGTGSGKTESFLYPIIDDLLKEISSGQKKPGIKAIFLYPMNALVNDQKDRIRSILKDYPQITFGSYTGETPETLTPSQRNDFYSVEGFIAPENELLSREEIRRNPPDLLFTNYSMLEYLMIRPEDYTVIGPETMKNWRYFVMDEAHTYTGAKAIELTFLLRRVTALAARVPQYILTSATLGDQQSTKDIIAFASSLTSSHYDYDDIIFAKRDALDRSHIRYQLSSSLYPEIVAKVNNIDSLYEFVSGYCEVNKGKDVEELLYYLLIHDRNVYELYDAIEETKPYGEVKQIMEEKFGFNDEELVSLVQLVSLANKDYKYLYDAKFHMFVKTPNRAFITLGKHPQLRFGNHDMIDEQKAFEIGICKNCNHLYIIGKIVNDILSVNESVDIYENYDDTINAKLDYFVLENEDDENLEAYTICTKCGYIYPQKNINHDHCHCKDALKRVIYKVNNEKSKMKNNLPQCVHCGAKNNNAGIIRGFSLNKDMATSVIASIFYDGMGESDVKEKDDSAIGDLFSLSVPTDEKPVQKMVKQLLAFSDSRQQASYFAISFNDHHERFLRKRLIWDEVKDQSEVPLPSLAAKIKKRIENEVLFQSDVSKAQSEAWIAVLHDLMNIDGRYSAEGLGLYSYHFDFSQVKGLLERNANRIQSLFGLSLDDFITLMNVAIMQLRNKAIINYDNAELTENDIKDAFQFSAKSTAITLKRERNPLDFDRRVAESFLPVLEGKTNVMIDYLMRALKSNYQQALKQAEMLFSLMVNLHILTGDKAKGLYKLKADSFYVRPYTHSSWYRCNICKRITLYNINQVCPTHECKGVLEPCDPDIIYQKNYYRQQYMTKTIERVRIEEHTAQLSKEKAREYQRKFKKKEINILSSSTTFEMGVDLGDLENVFLRNVPPTPANYVQRAGRAGRSKDAAALVVTYCGNNTHDFTYFNDPIKLINGIVKPPRFEVTNAKIALRHVTASALGFFFRKHPAYFYSLTSFVSSKGYQALKEYLKSKPADLGDYVDRYLLREDTFAKYRHFTWAKEILEDEYSHLNVFFTSIQDEFEEYQKAEKEQNKQKNYDLAKYFYNIQKSLSIQPVITKLSDYTVIPKYGFPVDVVDLNIIGKMRENKTEYNLTRDLSIAISEYAPGSEVVVDGEKYTSRYINLPKTGSLERYYYLECPNCGYTAVSRVPFAGMQACPECHESLDLSQNPYFIVPSRGFATDPTLRPSRTRRPMRTYVGEIKYLGGGRKDDDFFDYKNLVQIETFSEDEMLVMNKSHFYFCEKCGYTKIKAIMYKPYITERTNHKNQRGWPCDHKQLSLVSLGHIYKTDVIQMSFHLPMTRYEAITLMYALLEGLSHAFQIERNDINGVVKYNDGQCYDLILFDNVPGGAGHVKRLTNERDFITVLKEALNIVSKDCCDEETTCYNCLNNYYNQAYHKYMKKKYAKKYLKILLGDQDGGVA